MAAVHSLSLLQRILSLSFNALINEMAKTILTLAIALTAVAVSVSAAGAVAEAAPVPALAQDDVFDYSQYETPPIWQGNSKRLSLSPTLTPLLPPLSLAFGLLFPPDRQKGLTF